MTGKSETDRREGVIDENLRRVYDEALQEQIPDRFKMLLDQLKQQENETGQGR